jgi:hypothetical protein
MAVAASSNWSKGARWAALLSVWVATAWLLYPLIFIDNVDPRRSIEFFYRASGGIVLMIIMFGKTLTDLLFSQDLSRRRSAVSVAFLTVYTFAMAGGIIFMLVRVMMVYLNKNSATFTGGNAQF